MAHFYEIIFLHHYMDVTRYWLSRGWTVPEYSLGNQIKTAVWLSMVLLHLDVY